MLPRLPRQPIRPNYQEVDKEIWQPNWQCFCCHDTGLVHGLLILLVVPDYDSNNDKPVVCKRKGCSVGEDYWFNEAYDQRFEFEICQELDKLERENWKQTILSQQQLIKNRRAIVDAARGMSLRSRDRTYEEEFEAKIRAEALDVEYEEKLELTDD